MNKRRTLSSAIRGMFAVLIVAFVYVLVRGIGGAGEDLQTTQNADGSALGLALGETRLLRINNQPAWVTRLSTLQREQTRVVDDVLANPATGCPRDRELCALAAATARDGINLSFTSKVPVQLAADTPWFGGFVDPTNGTVYDLLGRAYRVKNTQPEALSLVDTD